MSLPHTTFHLRILVLVGLALGLGSTVVDAWDEIPPEDLAATEPTVDPDAGAEILYREFKVDNSSIEYGTVLRMKARIKVFTAKGLDELATIPIYHSNFFELTRLKARVVKSDGSEIEIKDAEVFETEVSREKDHRSMRTTFAPPKLEVGDIVEFEARFNSDYVSRELRLNLRLGWATRTMKILVKPISLPGIGVRITTYKVKEENSGKTSEGFYTYQITNVPAVADEPFSPPAGVIAPWILVIQKYSHESMRNYWKRYAREQYNETRSLIKPSRTIQNKAKEILAGVTGKKQQLKQLYEFCRTSIDNSYFDQAGRISPTQKDKIENDDSPEKVLKRGFGSAQNIRILFASLAAGAGFDARMARVSDRSEFYFTRDLRYRDALSSGAIAIRVGGKWRFFNPGNPNYAFGQLPWYNQGVLAMVADKKDVIFEMTASPEASGAIQKRTARLQLDEAGTLTGSVVLEFFGHSGIHLRSRLTGKTQEERREIMEEWLAGRIPDATVSHLELPDIEVPGPKLRVSFQITATGFAESLGDRLFVQPCVFERGAKPLFPASERIYDLAFHYPWVAEDDVELTLPPGFSLEAPSAPQSFDWNPVSVYETKLAVHRSADHPVRLSYHRRFTFHPILIKQKHYPTVKAMFDQVYEQDQHTLVAVLKETGSEAP